MRNKDIIKQYVNTGNNIPEYQLNKLNISLLKSYFRSRSRKTESGDKFKYYEFLRMDEQTKKSIIH